MYPYNGSMSSYNGGSTACSSQQRVDSGIPARQKKSESQELPVPVPVPGPLFGEAGETTHRLEATVEMLSCKPEKGSRKLAIGRAAGFRNWRQLPDYILQEILNRLGGDARVIAAAQLVCKDFWDAGNYVRSLRLTVLEIEHARARNVFDLQSLKSEISETATSSSSGLGFCESSSSVRSRPKSKDLMAQILKSKVCIVQLRIEVEPRLQSKTVPEDEKRRTDFWFSDPNFVNKWLPAMKTTLQHVCIVDYGQQAIMRRSSIIRLLSKSCKRLKTLDLRNMFVDTSECEEMPSMVSLTWRCIKVTPGALQEINEMMPKLQTLALLGVFGVEHGNLTFKEMKVLCLGLSSTAKEVVLDLPKLEKLQLKMQCPEMLRIRAVRLKYAAFNLEVREPCKLEFSCLDALQELLYGASSFITLSTLLERNRNLRKVFLDVPCMALAEDGRFLGVLKDVPLALPSFSKLGQYCEQLEVLNVGPGLWYCMETNVGELSLTDKWPCSRQLIVHMIPQNLDPVVSVLRLLLRLSVQSLVVRVHTSSPVKLDQLKPVIEAIIVADFEQRVTCSVLSWTMSLDLSCFSF